MIKFKRTLKEVKVRVCRKKTVWSLFHKAAFVGKRFSELSRLSY